jgi:CP family cyanate transporter-like MFS transporter
MRSEEADVAQEKRSESPWVMLTCACVMGFAMFAPMLCVPPIMHIIKEELLLSHAQAGLVFSVPLIALAAFALPSGALADRVGIRKAAGIGVIVIIVGSLLRANSTSFSTLLVFTLIYGAGLGLVYPNLPKLVGRWFPREKIGLATGIYATGILFGCAIPLAITLPVVFPITNNFQDVFYTWSVPAVIAAVVWWSVVKEPPRGSIKNKETAEGNETSYRIWSNTSLWLVAVLFFLSNFAHYTWAGWAPHLMATKGASPDLAALIASVVLWVCIPTVFFVPWASDKIGLRKRFLWGSFILQALVSLTAIHASLPFGWFVATAAGISGSAQFALLLILPPELLPEEGVGRGSGMMLSVGYMGGLVGPWVAGYIVDIRGRLDLHLIILAALAAFGVWLSFMLPETGPGARRHA